MEEMHQFPASLGDRAIPVAAQAEPIGMLDDFHAAGGVRQGDDLPHQPRP